MYSYFEYQAAAVSALLLLQHGVGWLVGDSFHNVLAAGWLKHTLFYMLLCLT